MDKTTIKKDVFTIRMDPELYDRMQKKLRTFRKNKSINKYVNELIEKDLKAARDEEL